MWNFRFIRLTDDLWLASCLVLCLLVHGVVVDEKIDIDAFLLRQMNLTGRLCFLMSFLRLLLTKMQLSNPRV
jgi:hypothetical protein